MKQSTKLLSLILALVMAFSFVTVIGNAALQSHEEVAYDNIDDADLTPEQVADIIMDLLDKLIKDGDMSDLDLSILGKVRMDSLDHIVGDFYSLYDSFWWTIGKGLLGDVGDLNLDNLNDTQRGNGDLNFLYDVLQLLDVNKGVLSKVAFGIGGDGLSLGLIGSFLSLGDIEDLLADLPLFATEMVYDMLIHGSYNAAYENESYPSVEELKANNQGLPSEVSSLDGILNRAIAGLLKNPQDYEWVGEGEDAVKDWDERALIMPTAASYDIGVIESYFSLTDDSNSLFQLIDKIAPFAIYDLGINALNHNLKKTLMEAVEVEFNEIDADTLPEDVYADFEVDDNDENDGTESYVTYIGYDRMNGAGDEWYYTTLKNDVVMENGKPVLDEEGNEKTQKVRKYYKANVATANEFYALINWEWEFYAPVPLSGDAESDDLNELNYEALIAENGSITESLNHLLYVVYETVLVDDVKLDFADKTQDGWLDGKTSEVIMDNLTRLLKYLLAEYADKIFGSDSAYVEWDYSYVENKTITELIALIGPSFFEDAMPQLIMPKNADGTYAFHEGVELVEFGALVLREFITEITPAVNYDTYIFAEGTVTSANDRHFKVQDSEAWFNIILNMGMDVAYTYLNQITNFNTAIPAQGITESRWQGMLDTAIIWATNYIGAGSSSVLNGLDPTTVSGKTGPFNKLSLVLNTILPLGFINGCTSDTWDFDVEVFFNKFKSFITTFDLTEVASLFGRNDASKYNAFQDEKLLTAVLKIVNRVLTLVFGTDLLPTTNTLNELVTKANIQTLLQRIFGALYTRREHLLVNALPVVAKFVQEWGGEQEMGTPEIALPRTIVCSNGALSTSFDIKNGSTGVWRHYKDASGADHYDAQYMYTITDISAYNYDGSASSYVSGISYSKDPIDFGVTIPVTYNVANVPAQGAVVKFVVKYTVSDEDKNVMAEGTEFEVSKYAWLNYNGSDIRKTTYDTGKKGQILGMGDYIRAKAYTDYYIGITEDWVNTITNTGAFDIEKTKNSNVTVGVRTSDTNAHTKQGIQYPNYYQKTSATDAISGTYTFKVADEATAQKFFDTIDNNKIGISWTVNGYANSTTAEFKNSAVNMYFYDGTNYNNLVALVDDENDEQRTANEYYTEGTYYADRVLVAADDTSTPDVNEKETNFANTAWVDAEGNPVAQGTTGAKEVTVIDAGAACEAYVTALGNAIGAAYQEFNGNSVFNFETLYEALRLAVNDIQYIRKTADVIAAEGGVSLENDVKALKAKVDSIEATYSDTMDYTDYKMYRMNRYNDAREDAKDIINAYEATLRTEADLTTYFPYTWIYPSDLDELVTGDPYEVYIKALLENYDEEEVKVNEANLENAKEHYAGYNLLDVAQADNLITRMSARLLKRDGGVQTKYLQDEITSADNMVKAQSNYTARSWAKYIEAYNDAKAVIAAPTQKTVFDAKYNLQVARNELVLVDDEADYSELKTLIAQAQQVMANTGLYDNTAKEIGQVLAELGYKDFKNADGDTVQLFPGSALYENAEPYAKDEQYKIDRAATALKEALARLKFKGLNITGANIATETIVPADKDNDAITASVARIAPELDADAVKALFAATAANTNVDKDNIIVSNDVNYTLKTEDDFAYAGTNATVTFYTEVSGVKVPVATIKVVVEADVNGDGALDVLDAALTELTANEHAELEGCYFIAANLDTASEDIAGADYTAVVNKVIA